MRTLMRRVLSAVSVLGITGVASAAPQKTQTEVTNTHITTSGGQIDGCLFYTWTIEGNEVTTKTPGDTTTDAALIIALTVQDTCAGTIVLSGFEVVPLDELNASIKGAEFAVTFEAERLDGGEPSIVEVDFSGTLTPSGPITSTKTNTHFQSGNTKVHETLTVQSRDATASGTIAVDALGLETQFSGAAAGITESITSIQIFSQE
jgi:hypothetical protein